jgi:N-acetylneuraminic acid mutarotase
VDAWKTMSNAGAPSGPRTGATAVWTGTEMIVWGGFTNRPEATGGRYDPATNSWSSVSTSVAPKARQDHVAVWTGSEMIVWGGSDGANSLVSGGRYDPATDTWTSMSLSGAPLLAADPRAVWTGTELIVWPSQILSTEVGGRYDPKTDTWKKMATAGAPTLQYSSAVWTGTAMIVWGGYIDNACESAAGAIYDPSTDTWRPTTTTGAPHPRSNHSAVWTGTQMIVWGGTNNSPNAASYDPVADAWYAISKTEAPSPRQRPALFFVPDQAGTPGAGRMLLWGGGYSYDAATGAIYDFSPDQWDVVAPFPSAPDSPNQDSTRTTVWTGTQMIVWDVAAGVGARYSP